MGDRLVIAFTINDDYKVSLYDHWGGSIVRNEDYREELIAKIRKLRELSNDFPNFLTMFIQFYREYTLMDYDNPYHVYLELIPSYPDNPVIVYDYKKDEVKIMDVEEFYNKYIEPKKELLKKLDWYM